MLSPWSRDMHCIIICLLIFDTGHFRPKSINMIPCLLGVSCTTQSQSFFLETALIFLLIRSLRISMSPCFRLRWFSSALKFQAFKNQSLKNNRNSFIERMFFFFEKKIRSGKYPVTYQDIIIDRFIQNFHNFVTWNCFFSDSKDHFLKTSKCSLVRGFWQMIRNKTGT